MSKPIHCIDSNYWCWCVLALDLNFCLLKPMAASLFCCIVGRKPNLKARMTPTLTVNSAVKRARPYFTFFENWIKCVTAFKLHLSLNWNRQLHFGLPSSPFLPSLVPHYSSFSILMTSPVWLNGSNVVQKLSCMLPALHPRGWTAEISKTF